MILLGKQQSIPESCNLKFVSIKTPIWHLLDNSNTWLFYTPSDIVTVICSNPGHSFTIEIFGVDRLITSKLCKIHAINSILFPIHDTETKVYLDIIPENPMKNLLSLITDTLKLITPQNLTKAMFQNFELLAQNSVNIKNLAHTSTEPLIIRSEFHYIIVHVSI